MSVPPRTTVPAVQALLQLNYDGQTDLNQFIAPASALVDQVIAYAAKKPVPIGLDSVTAELVERWLACHMYAQVDMLYTNKSTGGASASFQGQTTTDFASTRYGQTAMNIDYTGILRAIGERKFANSIWLGKPLSAMIPWIDRQ